MDRGEWRRAIFERQRASPRAAAARVGEYRVIVRQVSVKKIASLDFARQVECRQIRGRHRGVQWVEVERGYGSHAGELDRIAADAATQVGDAGEVAESRGPVPGGKRAAGHLIAFTREIEPFGRLELAHGFLPQ